MPNRDARRNALRGETAGDDAKTTLAEFVGNGRFLCDQCRQCRFDNAPWAPQARSPHWP